MTQDRLKEVLDYNPDTGVFKWKIKMGTRAMAGNLAGCSNRSDGYTTIIIHGASHKAHRLAWLYVNGYWSENEIDHINRDKSDNRISNLREVSRSCNMKNKPPMTSNRSGVVGVCWIKKKSRWVAQMSKDNKPIHLGTFKNKTDAVKARYEAEIKDRYYSCNSEYTAYKYLKDGGEL